MDKTLRSLKKLIPRSLFKKLQPYYHYGLAATGTLLYRFPSRKIHVIAVTGTKGKSSTTEYVNAVLEAGGYKTAVLSTIRFKIGDLSKPNLYKMTMPGRFFVQKFLREAVNADCQYAVIEMTSEGAKMYRHLGVQLDTLIFTNLSPEHIESHGSFEKYKDAKLRLARALAKSKKPLRRAIANITDPHGCDFLIYNIEKNIGYDEKDAKKMNISLPGDFNKVNALAAYTFGMSLGISEEKLKKAIANVTKIPGRAEEVDIASIPNSEHFVLKNIKVVVDYAHTADSLKKIYSAYKGKKIGVLGATGGGRDSIKRKSLGEVADECCDIVIVTDEDPYDDDIMEIINAVASGVTKKQEGKTLFIEPDRRKAIALAISLAKPNYSILITGKGTDPYIMRVNGTKEKWSDIQVAKEELTTFIQANQS